MEARSGRLASSARHGCTTRGQSASSTASRRRPHGCYGRTEHCPETCHTPQRESQTPTPNVQDTTMPDDIAPEQETTTGATSEASTEQDSPLEALRRDKDALQDRLLRTAAEFDN